MRWWISAIASLSLAGAALAAYKEIRDFTVNCTVGLTCDIQTDARDGDDGATSQLLNFAFDRKAGPDTPLAVALGVASPLKPGSELRFIVDGKPVATLPLSRFAYDADNWAYRLADDAEAMALLDAMRDAGRMQIDYVGDKGAAVADFSLSGLVASLIFVDEVQGRLHATDALQVKGSGQSPVPATRDITAIADIPAPIRGEFTAPDGACSFSEDVPSYFDALGAFEADVDDGYKLFALPCGPGGAYNQPFALFSVYGDEDDYQRLPLAEMGEGGPTATMAAWNIVWDQSKKTLAEFFKGRGLGDCGTWNRWALRSDGEGPAFVLVEARAKGDCDGNYAGGPQKWPLIWPAGRR